MRVKTIDDSLKSVRVFKVSSEDKTFIDKKFDALHAQRKLE